jgi:hypothetical protein
MPQKELQRCDTVDSSTCVHEKAESDDRRISAQVSALFYFSRIKRRTDRYVVKNAILSLSSLNIDSFS